MAELVILPKQGNSVEACILLTWQKQKGDQVNEGDVLCEVETDKAVMEVASPETGTLLETLYEEGIGQEGTIRGQEAEIDAPGIETNASQIAFGHAAGVAQAVLDVVPNAEDIPVQVIVDVDGLVGKAARFT